MQIKKLGKIISNQDGVIFNGLLFCFNSDASCRVYRLDEISDNSVPVAQFILDKADLIKPHCNCVVFGNERYHKEDEFPLLYCNVYNNYARAQRKLIGVTCVYRLERKENTFTTTLVQLIEIGFTDDPLWKSEHVEDARPYGNFVIDTKNDLYYAFTMRDEEHTTRYFAFDLPKLSDGEYDDRFGVKHVVLQKEDIKDYFDTDYHKFIQGGCFHNGIIYSVEGFTNSKEVPPAIRLIDVKKKKQQAMYHFQDFGLTIEPELIDFDGEICYYSDDQGNLHELIF